MFGPVTSPYGADLGITQWMLGYGGHPFFVAADITNAGFVPKGFFDAAAPNGGTRFIGAAFRFYFITTVNGQSVPTDIDNNGLLDAAFFEIYYNDSVDWQIDTIYAYDLETVGAARSGPCLEPAPLWAGVSNQKRQDPLRSAGRDERPRTRGCCRNQPVATWDCSPSSGRAGPWNRWARSSKTTSLITTDGYPPMWLARAICERAQSAGTPTSCL